MEKITFSKRKLREFGLLIGFLFPLIIGFIIPFFTGHIFKLWTLILGIILIIFAILSPNSLKYPYKLWMKTGLILGWVNSRLILGLIFLLVLIPISIIMKILGYDPLRKKFNNSKSYKEDTSHRKIDIKRIF